VESSRKYRKYGFPSIYHPKSQQSSLQLTFVRPYAAVIEGVIEGWMFDLRKVLSKNKPDVGGNGVERNATLSARTQYS